MVAQPTSVVDLALEAGLADSKNSAKRLIQGGGVRLDDDKINADRVVDPSELPALLSVGKRKVRLVPA